MKSPLPVYFDHFPRRIINADHSIAVVAVAVESAGDGATATSQRWIVRAAQFGLLTHIAATESFSLYAPMNC